MRGRHGDVKFFCMVSRNIGILSLDVSILSVLLRCLERECAPKLSELSSLPSRSLSFLCNSKCFVSTMKNHGHEFSTDPVQKKENESDDFSHVCGKSRSFADVVQ